MIFSAFKARIPETAKTGNADDVPEAVANYLNRINSIEKGMTVTNRRFVGGLQELQHKWKSICEQAGFECVKKPSGEYGLKERPRLRSKL